VNMELVKPTDLCLEITPETIGQAERQSQYFSSPSSCQRAYLNIICLKTFLSWLQEIYPNQVQMETDEVNLNYLWEVVNGTTTILNDRRLIIIPSSTIDTEEFRVEREWLDLPNLVGDYYLAAQVDEADMMVRIWGYTTHKHLKEKGNYTERDRTYYLDREDLIFDLDILWLSSQLCPNEPTQNEVAPISALPLDRANKLLEYLGDRQTIFPRRLVDFTEWGALLENPNLRRQLYERRVAKLQLESTAKVVNLRQWFQGVFEAGWQAAEDLINPQLLLGFRPIEIKRGKVIDLGINAGGRKVVLVVRISEVCDRRLRIQVQIYPGDNCLYLPSDLRLVILDEDEDVFEAVTARTQDKLIQYEFEGDSGEQFKIKIGLKNALATESFVIG
jgi:hypothetical protein